MRIARLQPLEDGTHGSVHHLAMVPQGAGCVSKGRLPDGCCRWLPENEEYRGAKLR
jgi:hypothetical protein